MREQIIALHENGHGKKAIARMLGISRNTVKGILESSRAAPQSPDRSTAASPVGDWSDQTDWSAIQCELGKKYATIKAIHLEYAPAGISYLRFWRALQKRFPDCVEDKARIRFHYKPGERVEIDYCDGFNVVDPTTGSSRKTHLFCAVSSSSDYTYGEFCFTQRRDEFIAAQERMHAYFGGVFRYAVIDNLKSGVRSAHIYDPDLNPVYVDFANHMGFAVTPARPVTPRDKPAIETAVGVIQRQFFAVHRNRVFTSLRELNESFRGYLEEMNHSSMKDYGVSRAVRFEEEKAHLKPLPDHPFEISEFRKCKVHPDCHVQVDRNFYSVPYALIGQTLRVKVTPRLIQIFNGDHESIAVHSRKTGIGKFSTEETHYPLQKLAAARFDIQLLRRDAGRIGPHTSELIEGLVTGSHPLRYLRRCQGILRLAKTCTPQAIEHACHQATLFNRPRLAYITDCARRFDLYGNRPVSTKTPERDLSSVYLLPRKPIPKEESEWQ